MFNAIAEDTEGATTINAGYETLPIAGADVAMLNELQTLAKAPWNDARPGRVHLPARRGPILEQARPRVLYLSFNDTDSWAHEGRYDRLLDAYAGGPIVAQASCGRGSVAARLTPAGRTS